MTMWAPDPTTLTRPAYRSLAQAIVLAINAGRLRPGERLPTHRALAQRLGLSVQTVSRAYEKLIRDGFVAGAVGRGTFVKASSGDPRTMPYQQLEADDPVIDCSMLTPVIGPLHRTAMDAALAELSGRIPAEVLFSFRPRQTLQRRVERALPWLAGCGIAARPERVVPTNGATAAMTVALMTAAAPGEVVMAETMSHHTLKPLTHYLGLRMASLAADDEGVLPQAVAAAHEEHGARVLYLMPAGNGPEATVMSPARRAEVVTVARRLDLRIVENDAWGPLEPDRPPPLAALAPERVFYFTSLTKCLLPGLRIGWLVVPEASVTEAFGRHLVSNWMATALIAEIGARWIADGTARRLLAWQRRQLARRNVLAKRALAGLPHRANPHGLHVWLHLPAGWDERAFVNSARLRGVAITPASAFDTRAEVPAARGIRICLGAASEPALAQALTTLASLARNRPEPDFLTI